jgi:hypothetical protein
MKYFLALILVGCLLSGCSKHKDPDRWNGIWPGVEGTSLALGIDGDNVEVNIRDLDNVVKTYEGKKVGSHIEFTRNNVLEKIKFGDGKASGMKWFADKKKCLVIKSGEGFCRK